MGCGFFPTHTLAWSSCRLSTGLVSSSFFAIISVSICLRYRPMISSSAYWCSSRDNHSSAKPITPRCYRNDTKHYCSTQQYTLYPDIFIPLFSCCSSFIWVFSWVRSTWGLYLLSSWISEESSMCWKKQAGSQAQWLSYPVNLKKTTFFHFKGILLCTSIVWIIKMNCFNGFVDHWGINCMVQVQVNWITNHLLYSEVHKQTSKRTKRNFHPENIVLSNQYYR